MMLPAECFVLQSVFGPSVQGIIFSPDRCIVHVPIIHYTVVSAGFIHCGRFLLLCL